MSDEIGPLDVEPLHVGDLPDRLVEAALAYAEFSRAAAPWLRGDVHVPLAQLEDLGRWAKAMAAVSHSVVSEARLVHRQTVQRRHRNGTRG